MVKKNADNNFTEHRKCMRELDFQIRSNRPLIYICTHEEDRVLDAIKNVCNRSDDKKWEFYTWDIAAGLRSRTKDVEVPQKDIMTILPWFNDQSPKSSDGFQILVLCDFHKLIGSDGNAGQFEHQLVRDLKNQSQINMTKHKCIIMIGTTLFLPPELEKICAVIDWPLPERPTIAAEIEKMLVKINKRPDIAAKFITKYSNEELDDIISAFQGLTLVEIELLCAYMVLTNDKFDPKLIASRKREIIRKSGIIDWIDVENSLNSVGGLHALKDWLTKRKNAFTNEAKEYGLPENPKGILLIGIQGCGKSLSAQAIASFWGLPLLRLDMGKVFSGTVGSSEENMRSVEKISESVAPCILWCDEIEKGLSGTGSSNNTDGGTASRVFGSLLNWMQEKKKPVYIAATANDVSQLPPELLRKGRFDEIFFVDLPSSEEREEIWRIHLSKRNRDPLDFDIFNLVNESKNYTGAEIESVIISAMYEAFSDEKRQLTTEDILMVMTKTIPLSVTMKEHIEKMRTWANDRARNASLSNKMDYNKDKSKKQTKKTLKIIDDDHEEL